MGGGLSLQSSIIILLPFYCNHRWRIVCMAPSCRVLWQIYVIMAWHGCGFWHNALYAGDSPSKICYGIMNAMERQTTFYYDVRPFFSFMAQNSLELDCFEADCFIK